jgi:hypothetical protein
VRRTKSVMPDAPASCVARKITALSQHTPAYVVHEVERRCFLAGHLRLHDFVGLGQCERIKGLVL